MWRLVREICELVKTWWAHDRIRCSPLEGRLLRMASNSVLLIDGEWAMVKRRTVHQSRENAFVQYDCETREGAATLRLSPQRGGVQWKVGPNQIELDQAEIEIFPAATRD